MNTTEAAVKKRLFTARTTLKIKMEEITKKGAVYFYVNPGYKAVVNQGLG